MTAYYNENDPGAAAWLRELISSGLIAPGNVDERDIQDVRPNDLRGYTQHHFFAGIGGWSYALRLAGWPDERSVWTGSCPCQPFSNAGGGLGFDDPRHLWPAWLNLIRELRPLAVFGEQVASKRGLAWLDLVQADMEGADYALGAVDTCAAGVGAPHLRQRLYWVADATSRQQRRIRQRRPSDAREKQSPGGHRPPVRVADTHDEGLEIVGQQPAREKRQAIERGGAVDDASGGMGDADMQRCNAGQCGDERRETEPWGTHGDVNHRPSPLNGFWRDAVWLPCRDGKARPVEPGSFPVAHGLPARVGRLRGYGNAINPWQAAAFIGAFMQWEEQRAMEAAG
ncbi:MAG: DNA cytosine methyltransferase [Desulfovibrio sp.]